MAETYHLNRHTVAKWRQREGLADASHRHHRLQVTLGAAQETVVALRSSFLLPLDDLLANSSTPRSRVDVKSLPQMPDEDQRQYLFTAINRAMRWVYVELLQDKSAASASGFLKRLIENARFTINKVLPDNGKKFTDRFCATGERQPTGAHAFDQVCAASHIEHRLIKPRTSQTNGMIERFNGRIADVLATTHFDSSQHLTDTIKRYVQVYNHHIPQKALGYIPPLQAMKNWYQKQPNLFKKRVYSLAELDT